VVFGIYDMKLMIRDQAGLVLTSESIIQFLFEAARPLGPFALLVGFTRSALYL